MAIKNTVYIDFYLCSSIVLAFSIAAYLEWCLMVKKYGSHVNNQSLEQIYKDMLEKLKMEACSVQEHIQ